MAFESSSAADLEGFDASVPAEQDRVLQAYQRAVREGDVTRLSIQDPTPEELHRMQVLLADTEGQECLPCAMCHSSTPYSLLNNGHPVTKGDVCSSCWAHHVVPARLLLTAQWRRQQRSQQSNIDSLPPREGDTVPGHASEANQSPRQGTLQPGSSFRTQESHDGNTEDKE